MAVSATLYRSVLNQAFGSLVSGSAPNIDWLSDTIKVMLLTSTYTPNLDTHKFKSDLTNEITGTGYTAGGATLGSAALTYTVANSWGTQWAVGTAYTVGQIVRPTAGNGHLYRCIVAGTSHASTQPTWPTVSGQVVTDNTVTWAECGAGIHQFDGADVSWASSTITARYAVIYDATPGSDATRPLIGLIDFGADQTTNNGTFQITWDALGIFVITTP
jgi:hypothetical protein